MRCDVRTIPKSLFKGRDSLKYRKLLGQQLVLVKYLNDCLLPIMTIVFAAKAAFTVFGPMAYLSGLHCDEHRDYSDAHYSSRPPAKEPMTQTDCQRAHSAFGLADPHHHHHNRRRDNAVDNRTPHQGLY